MEIPIVQDVLKLNDEIAQLNRATLADAGVCCVNLLGSPGCGKTTLLEQTLAKLRRDFRVGVLTGDLTTTRDSERLSRHCRHVIQINTGKGCHLDANQVRQGINAIPIGELNLLFIENVGNLICPVGFDLGQDVKVGMFSATDGDDKPAKHPQLVLEADLLVLNKCDLLRHVPFDISVFKRDLFAIRADVPLLELSAVTGEGMDEWLTWLSDFATSRTHALTS
jgi:hydrogenase nickel incorporation protein HypB